MAERLQIEHFKLDELNIAVWNPRQISDKEKADLRRSMETFGCVEPLVIRKADMSIVGGHQRYYTAIDLHLEELPCVVIDIDETQAKQLNIALNKIHGEWDVGKLSEVIGDLRAEGADIDITGFSEIELSDMGLIELPPEPQGDPDAVPPPPPESISKRGDLYILGEHRLLCGDSTKAEDVARLMDGQKADMVFTDPPYGMCLDTNFTKLPKSKIRGKATHYPSIEGDNKPFNYAKMEITAVEEFWWGGDWYYESLPAGGSWIVWDKRTEASDEMVGNAFELCWSKRKHRRGFIRHYWYGVVNKEKGEDERFHPAQKPTAVLCPIIETYSVAPNIICDPFLGSGSTLIACEQLNRRCYGMEIEPRYVDVAVKRWEDFTGRKAELEGA